MKRFLIFILIFLSSFVFSGCKKTEQITIPTENLTNYSINLTLNTQTKQATATQSVDFFNSTGDVLKNLKLHLYIQNFKEGATKSVISNTKLNQAYPNGMDYAEFEIEKLTCNNVNLNYSFENEFKDILSIDLNNSLLPNNRICFEIVYSFKIPNCQHRFGYGENTINLSNFYPIMCVYENDKFNTAGYTPNGDPFYSDIANYSVSIETESQYIVAGTGYKTIENANNNQIKTTFTANGVRDFAIVLSNKFEVISEKVNGTEIYYYYFNDSNAAKSLKAGVDAIKTFSSLFGNYPYKTFSIVKTDFVHGGMEFPNLVMIASNIDNVDDYLNVIVHETAHQWWYGIVGNDQIKYPWIDEALTEFSTVLFYDYNEGYSLTHEQMINSSKENYSLFIEVYEQVLGKIDTSMRPANEYETEPEYTYCIYVKGVLMFESLFNLVGEDKFIKSLNLYFNTNKFAFAQTKNLVESFNQVCNQDFTNFFNSWIS